MKSAIPQTGLYVFEIGGYGFRLNEVGLCIVLTSMFLLSMLLLCVVLCRVFCLRGRCCFGEGLFVWGEKRWVGAGMGRVGLGVG